MRSESSWWTQAQYETNKDSQIGRRDTAKAKLTDPRLDLRALHAADMPDDVVDKVFTINVFHDSSVKDTWLFKVHCRIKFNHLASLGGDVDD